MATTTETVQSPPELTILSRVASIPLISSIDSTLSKNPYTSSPYTIGKGLSTSAYRLTGPIQTRLAPLLTRADGYANKAVDVVESRYPYPFKASPDEVADYVRERRQSATEYANNTINERVVRPASSVVKGVDQRFAPIVDYFEVAVTRLDGSEAGPSTPQSEYQYQRALALSNRLKDQIYLYSNDQLKQLQTQNALVHRATETAQSITALASSSLSSAQSRIHTLSDTMLSELQRLQGALHASGAQLQSASGEYAQQLGAAVSELRTIVVNSDDTAQEKVSRVARLVREQVQPLLAGVRAWISEVRAPADAANLKPNGNGHGVNGNGNRYSE